MSACLPQYDLDDNGRLDSNEFVKMLGTLGADVSTSEAEAAMEVSRQLAACHAWQKAGAVVT